MKIKLIIKLYRKDARLLIVNVNLLSGMERNKLSYEEIIKQPQQMIRFPSITKLQYLGE